MRTQGASHRPTVSEAHDLTKFQVDILAVLYKRSRPGAGVRQELEDLYGEEINHRRVYENLNKLAELELIEKDEFAISDKSHEYRITREGKLAIFTYGSELALRLSII